MPALPSSALVVMAGALLDIADTIRSDYPFESNVLTNMSATLSAALPDDVRPVGNRTKDDPAATQEAP